MAALWKRCAICGAVITDQELHEQWHESHGEQVSDADDERAQAPDPR